MRIFAFILALIPMVSVAQVAGTGGNVYGSNVVRSCDLTENLECGTLTASITRATSTWCLQASGQYAEATSGNACFGVGGLSVWQAVTNYWQNSLDATSSAAVGTPIVTANQGSGPFSTYAGGAEADSIEDNDAGGGEGIESDTAGIADDTYTCSFWGASGTETGYRFAIVVDGTPQDVCTGDDLTATYARKECSSTTSGAATDITCQITVGNADADTGTILVTGLHLEKASFAGRPCLAAGATATCNADTISVATSGLPTNVGFVSLTYRLDNDASATTRTIFDSRGASTDGVYMRGRQGSAAQVVLDGPGGATANATGALSWAVDTDYTLTAQWGNGAATVSRYAGHVGQAGGASEMPAAHAATARIGASYLGAQHINGFVKDLVFRRH